jgi:hypothetical protein
MFHICIQHLIALYHTSSKKKIYRLSDKRSVSSNGHKVDSKFSSIYRAGPLQEIGGGVIEASFRLSSVSAQIYRNTLALQYISERTLLNTPRPTLLLAQNDYN